VGSRINPNDKKRGSIDTQRLTLDRARDFSLYGSVGQVAKPQRSNLLNLNSVLRQTSTMILAGGQGERLSPLTGNRAKPAVPFGGIYRIVARGLPLLSVAVLDPRAYCGDDRYRRRQSPLLEILGAAALTQKTDSR
jgi:hypothetical protein